MTAIPVFKRTIYECNPLQYGPNMIAIFKIALDPRDYYFWTNLAITNFQLLQSYKVYIGKD